MSILDLTDSNFDENVLVKGSGVIIVYFHAAWCGPCTLLGPRITELASTIKNATFFKADVEQCQNIATRFGVRSLPTLIAFKDTKFVAYRNGVISNENILKMIEEAVDF
jgi:thioredoxin 1